MPKPPQRSKHFFSRASRAFSLSPRSAPFQVLSTQFAILSKFKERAKHAQKPPAAATHTGANADDSDEGDEEIVDPANWGGIFVEHARYT